MSAISITAPQITDEEVRREQETYTPEEIEAARLDVYGGSSYSTETTEMPVLEGTVKDAADPAVLELFRQTLDDYPPEDKEASLEALERAPYLIGAETDPQLFLRGNTVIAAVECFINYWELRRWLFGERAWLPMTATGNGALSPEDVELLRTGFVTLLPQEDRHGRGIVCFQVPTKSLNADRLAMARVTFYVVSLALRSRPLVSQNGIVVVANTRKYTMERYDRKFIKCISYLFTGWHPVKTRAIHLTAPPGSRSCLKLVLPFLRFFMTRQLRQRFHIHRGTTAQCALDLKEFGIATYSLPVEMGGEFHIDQFRRWLEDFIKPLEFHRETDYVSSLEMEGYFYSSDGSLVVPTDDDDTEPGASPPPGESATLAERFEGL